METKDDSNFLDDDVLTSSEKCLTEKEKELLASQNTRKVTEFKANQLEQQAQKNWDLFYKRNETKFFKDRRWTTREFAELLGVSGGTADTTKKLLEIGCGVGNFVFPLLEDELKREVPQFYYYACDFSPRAVDFVKSHQLYDEKYIKAFQCDVTTNQLMNYLEENSLDVVTMIFVLSAINPHKFKTVITNVWRTLKVGGVVLFRDYGLHDMAQLRFKPGHKISENFYMRQDGTRSYYFSEKELADLFVECGFSVISCTYIHRRTKNLKEGIDVPRIFLQGKFRKTLNS